MNRRKIISDNLNVIKAIAIIWIVFYHFPVECNIPILKEIKNIGYGGVDIFIFIAGFGLYHSLERNDIGTYFFRRVKNIVPYYMPFIIVFLAVRKITYQLYLTEAVGNITMTGWFAGTPGQFNWYVDALLVLYILAPVVYGIVEKTRNIYCGVISAIAVTLFISIGFWHTDLLILASRIPLFVLGFYFADKRIDDFLEKKIALPILNVMTIAGFTALFFFLNTEIIDRWHYGTWWYPFLLIVPGLVFDLAIVLSVIRTKIKMNLFESIGKVTFSIYLWHIWFFSYVPGLENAGDAAWIAIAVLIIVFAWLYHNVIKKLVELITNG